jgi:small-conductance mechanosensitive channel
MNGSSNVLFGRLQEILDYPLIKFGNTQFTPLTLAKIAIWLLLVLVLQYVLRAMIIQRVLKRTRMDAPLQFAIGKFAGYVFVALGFYVALQVNGVDLSSLAVLAGAVGVGLGFGLQNVVHNFVSGLIILAERPIAIGDRVEVGEVAGQVSRISLRSTVVITNDNISIIVPNSDFISNKVTNWSYGDPKVRLRLPVGVAYGSDIEKLRKVLLAVAEAHPKVLREPAPELFFSGFGDSSLNFELGVWTAEMTSKPRRFRSELNYAIEKALRDNAIEIPFPQRDLHLRSGSFNLGPATAAAPPAPSRQDSHPGVPQENSAKT